MPAWSLPRGATLWPRDGVATRPPLPGARPARTGAYAETEP